MEIVGVVQKVTDTFITLETISKKQQIDIFFTENKSEPIYLLYQPHVVTRLEVDMQSIEIGHVNLAKIWLKHVIFPPLPIDHGDFSVSQEERRKKIMILYKAEDR